MWYGTWPWIIFNPKIIHFPYGKVGKTRRVLSLASSSLPLRFLSGSGFLFRWSLLSWTYVTAHPVYQKYSVPCSFRVGTLEGPTHPNILMNQAKGRLCAAFIYWFPWIIIPSLIPPISFPGSVSSIFDEYSLICDYFYKMAFWCSMHFL